MASPTPTNLNLPESLPYPIAITSLLVNPGDTVPRGAPLCDYSFEYKLPATWGPSARDQLRQKETRYGRWECPIDGVFDKWLIRKGDTVPSVEAARMHPIAILMEDCPHSTQIHGLCALCGRDMTGVDYLGSNASRATIRMTHDADGPTVSMSEAMRYDWETSERLLKGRKLSLIVDLDQTIVHATVDPTVGEWMDEASRFEEKQRVRHEKMPNEADGIKDSRDGEEEEEDVNPNWAALRDVKRFKLGGEGLPLGANGQEDGSWYYIKPRPGLSDFLSRLKHKYEMHVYTMGTRAYAFEVCKAIDPDQTIFNNRVLTRDESGSMTSKNLQRLFPSDQSMVAIIDDRSDVWANVPNLIKVNPYDFFVGIGDINSAHLPASPPPTGSRTPPAPLATPAASLVPPTSPATIAPSDVAQISPEVEAEAAALAGRKDIEDAAISRAQSLVIEHVVHDRPLAKMQEKLDMESELGERASSPVAIEKGDVVERNMDAEMNGHDGDNRTETGHSHKVKHKMLLHNNDNELQRVEEILNNVHHQFYAAHDLSRNKGRRTTDIREFIMNRKSETFAGLHFTFSNVFPTNVDPRMQPIWHQAEAFGAKCYPTWTESITHVVAVKLRSEKTDRGQRKPATFVVHPQWLWDCITLWKRMPEEPYVEMLKVLEAADVRAGSSVPNVTSPSSPPLPHADATSLASSKSVDSTSIGTESLPSIEVLTESRQGDTPVVLQSVGSPAGTDETSPPTGPFVDQSVDWAAVDEEVDAFLNETDDDDMEDHEMEEDGSDGSARSNGFRTPRKRRRSASVSSDDSRFISDKTGSPLSKRLKLSRDRRGHSGLKVEVFKNRSNSSSGVSDEGDDDDDDSEDLNTSAEDRLEDDDVERRAQEEELEEIEADMRDATDDEGETEEEDEDFLARDIEFG